MVRFTYMFVLDYCRGDTEYAGFRYRLAYYTKEIRSM